MKAKSFGIILAICSALILAGCSPTITNLTSKQVPQNASGIYTLSMAISNDNGNVPSKSYKPAIVIDGEVHPMRQSEVGRSVYEYEYTMPQGRSEARFYYILDYDVTYSGKATPRQTQSGEVYTLKLLNRYVLTMESQRGPVGAEIVVVGRGFQPGDRVVMGGYQTETRYSSGSSLTFRVPPLPAGRSYQVQLVNPQNTISVGNFFIDPSKMLVSPQSIQLAQGEKTNLTLRLASPAPEGGLHIIAQTDIPTSVIMPEVSVRTGERSISIPVEGGNPGTGTLYLSANGYSRVDIPFSVTASTHSVPPLEEGPVQTGTTGDISDARITEASISEGQPLQQNEQAASTPPGEGEPINQANEIPPALVQPPLQPSQTSEQITTDADGNVILQQSDLIPVTR